MTAQLEGSLSPAARRILEAALVVIDRGGAAALSIRSTAEAAGVSPAQVQYYFRSKQALVTAAYDLTGELFVADLVEHVNDERTVAQLRRIVERWLPLDQPRARRARIWLAFLGTAVTEPDLRRVAAARDAQLRQWLVGRITLLQQRGEVAAVLDAASLSGQLLALIDGLTGQLLLLPEAERGALATSVLTGFFERWTVPNSSHPEPTPANVSAISSSITSSGTSQPASV